jgi:hypothetical protein
MFNGRSNPMSSMVPRVRRSAGFSLAEALMAFVIAAMLAAALTRFISNTRMNAGEIRELVEMMTLSDSLLEQTSPQEPGITEGPKPTRADMLRIVRDVGTFDISGTIMNLGPKTQDAPGRVFITVIQPDGTFKAIEKL